MSKNDELFQEDQLEEELEVLARAGNQLPGSFKSSAYNHLKQFHAARAAADAQAIERVGQRLAMRASSYMHQPQSAKRLRHLRLPWSISSIPPYPVRKSSMRAFAGALVAVLMVGVLVSGFVLLLHSRLAPTKINPSLATGFGTDASRWHLVASPNVPKMGNTLNAVSAAKATDAWAVGTSGTMTRTFQGNNIIQTTTSVPLTEHWDGQQWKIISTPQLPGQVSIFAVADIAPGDAWLVGSVANMSTVEQSTVSQALIEHWDGQQWQVIASPSLGNVNSELRSIAALAPNDIWAVGDTEDRSTHQYQALIEHWNGQQWHVVSGPRAGGFEVLTGVAAISANDIWAVGSFKTERAQPQTLVERWNGSQWHIVSSPSPGSLGNILHGIAVVSANDVWVIGDYDNGDYYNYKTSHSSGSILVTKTLVEHWDGQHWQVVPSPNLAPAGTDLVSITSLGANDIWIASTVTKILPNARPDQSSTTFNELIEHWDGQKWRFVDHSPSPGGSQSLCGITPDPAVPGKLWIVGEYGSSFMSNDSKTLIETNM